MITRIKAPKFKVGKYSLNEYELRQLMLEVAKGQKSAGQAVKDVQGSIAYIQPDGTLSRNLSGLDINSIATLAMLRIRRDKEVKEAISRRLNKKKENNF